MNLDILNEYTFLKHNVLPGTQSDSIEDVARNHLGLHSARIMTPYTTLCSRLNEYAPEMLTSKLYEEKKLIKMRCMRTTLHMVPLDIASILHMSTLDLRLSDCRLFFKRNSITLEQVEDLENELFEFVNEPKSSDEIEKKILEKLDFIEKDLKKECAKKILKYFWEKGVFCYVNYADSWEKEDRRYAITKKFYPNAELEKYDVRKAQELLVLEYISKFGPATIKDLSWWSGLSIKMIRDVVGSYKDAIIKFTINDFEDEFYILAEEYQKIKEYKQIETEWITLLAYEDPSLKGYYESRYRYVDKKDYNLLFNQIGEVRASIIYNGKAIGVWEWDKKNKYINLNYFSNPDKQVKRKVNEIKEQYENILYTNRQITLFDNCF